ncbi:MAG: terpene cyclase/mutase family protein [Planctomycetes bacterium]|nr:terpene cyclase/mutase family protein [Planctomycetota bacterium]
MNTFAVEEAGAERSAGLADALQDQFGATPWWLISILLHMLFLLTAMVVIVARKPDTISEKFVLLPDKAVENRERTVEELPETATTDPDVTCELKFSNVEYNPDPEIEAELDVLKGTDGLGETGIAEFDTRIPIMGPGGDPGGRKGLPVGDPYRDRDPGRLDPDRRHALARALEWLARHQEADGHWDGEKHEGEDTDAGITGLATLAFLGAGHTETSGRYRANVSRAVGWMIREQQDDGCIGRTSRCGGLGYHHSICGMALAQAYAMSKRRPTGEAAQKAVDYSVYVHQVPYSGWRYGARETPDTSVTGWFMMQLKSAQVARLKVPAESFIGATNFLDKVTNAGDYAGRAGYQDRRQFNRTLTAVALTGRLFTRPPGENPLKDPVIRGAADYIIDDLPAWGNANEHVNFYYWYYAGVAMFQLGGDYWKKWYPAMKEPLTANQRAGGDEDGSWDPVGQWCSRGGRVYSTAMGALCLEIYIIYSPLFHR